MAPAERWVEKVTDIRTEGLGKNMTDGGCLLLSVKSYRGWIRVESKFLRKEYFIVIE